MYIYSENIRQYIINNTTIINNKITQNNLEQIEDININKLNLKLEEAVFIPEELKLLINLKSCTLLGFDIDDKLLNNINELKYLNKLDFEYCKYNGSSKIINKILEIRLKDSDITLLNIINTNILKTLTMENIDNIDLLLIAKYKKIEKLKLLNCNITNFDYITELKDLKELTLIGTNIENSNIHNKVDKNVNIIFDENKYLRTN